MFNFVRENKWSVILSISLVCNLIAFYLFGHLHIDLWDNIMNNILISREEFAMMNRRGALFFFLSIATSMILVKTFTDYNYKNNEK